MVGLGFGFVAAAWRDFADRVFRTVHQVESTLQTDCIALIPMVKNEDPNDQAAGRWRGRIRRSGDFYSSLGGLGRKLKLAGQRRGLELADMVGQRVRDCRPETRRRKALA